MNDLLLQVIVIAIIANVVLLLIALIGPRFRRALRRSPASTPTMAATGQSGADGGPGHDGDEHSLLPEMTSMAHPGRAGARPGRCR